MDDDDLIAALADGDDTALRELSTRHAPRLAARLRHALPSEDVEYVLQETFLAVWKGARTYTPRGTPEAWLWVIARNQAALLLRKRGPVTLPLDPEAPQTGTDPPGQRWPGPTSAPRRPRSAPNGRCGSRMSKIGRLRRWRS